MTREMDGEVATKVFGWLFTATDGTTNYGNPPLDEMDKYENCGDGYKRIPRYAEDISAAFTVVERMRERGWRYQLEYLSDGQIKAQFIPTRVGDEWGVAIEKETPLGTRIAANTIRVGEKYFKAGRSADVDMAVEGTRGKVAGITGDVGAALKAGAEGLRNLTPPQKAVSSQLLGAGFSSAGAKTLPLASLTGPGSMPTACGE